MGLVTAYSDANKERHQLEATVTVRSVFYVPAIATYYWYVETITTDSFSYVGMTEAAAANCVTAMKSTYTKNVVTAVVNQQTGEVSTTTKNMCVADIKAVPEGGLMWRVDVDVREVATSIESMG